VAADVVGVDVTGFAAGRASGMTDDGSVEACVTSDVTSDPLFSWRNTSAAPPTTRTTGHSTSPVTASAPMTAAAAGVE